jgi:hypothetical protein
MPQSKASATKIHAAERRTKALELRKQGRTYAEIGAALGCSEQRAHAIVTAELGRLNRDRAEQAEAVRRLELDRLDALQAGVWDAAKGGDAQAIDRVLSIMARRAKLMGLDAPTKTAFTDPSGRKSVAVPVSAQELSDDDLARIAAGGGGGAAAPPPGA